MAYVLNEFAGQTAIVFVATCNSAQRIALLLRNLGFGAISLHGKMTQPKRLVGRCHVSSFSFLLPLLTRPSLKLYQAALNKFKSGERNILIATDVASRGLDIPSVDIVLNVDIPSHGKDYIHRLVTRILSLKFLI